jgi:ribonuclease HIII
MFITFDLESEELEPTVVKINPEQLEELRWKLLDSTDSSDLALTSEYESFRIMFAGEAIIGYTSGKVVSNGPYSAAAVQNAILEMITVTEAQIVIGSDEAGKGEWLGPMTVAAVALTQKQSAMLQSLGVMDSKSMSVVRIAELAQTVRQNSLELQRLVISPEKFNEQIEEFREEGKNLNDMLAWAHAKVISEVYKSIQNRDENIMIVVDEFARVKTEQRIMRKIDLDTVELVQRPKAEDEVAVAAASIVAREAREDWLDRASTRMGFDLRELSIQEASNHSHRISFSKISYIESELSDKK